MDLSTGTGKKLGGAAKKQRQSGKKTTTSRKTRKTPRRKSKKLYMPKTASLHSRKSARRVSVSRANTAMPLTELQFMAKSRGIPFGGLSRAKLVRKINNYMY